MKNEKIKKALAGMGMASLVFGGGVTVSSCALADYGTGCGSSCGKGKSKVEGRKTGCGSSSCSGKNMKMKGSKTSCSGNMTKD